MLLTQSETTGGYRPDLAFVGGIPFVGVPWLLNVSLLSESDDIVPKTQRILLAAKIPSGAKKCSSGLNTPPNNGTGIDVSDKSMENEVLTF